MIKTVSIKKSQFLEACDEFYKYMKDGGFKGSFTNTNGLIAGILGEILVADYLKARRKNTKDYDLIKDGYKVDVKTKRTSVVPLEMYSCSVYETSQHQEWDRVYFVRINYSFREGYLLGWLSHDEFYDKAKFCVKGEIFDGKPVQQNCYNIYIKDLRSRWTK